MISYESFLLVNVRSIESINIYLFCFQEFFLSKLNKTQFRTNFLCHSKSFVLGRRDTVRYTLTHIVLHATSWMVQFFFSYQCWISWSNLLSRCSYQCNVLQLVIYWSIKYIQSVKSLNFFLLHNNVLHNIVNSSLTNKSEKTEYKAKY